MQADSEREQRGVLPLRFGEGAVEGIRFNTIVPDIRQKSVEEAAQLILARLQLLRRKALLFPALVPS